MNVLTYNNHTTDLANEVLQAAPRDFGISLLLCLGQVSIEDLWTHSEVRLIEVVWHIPANFAILASLLHHSMEEGQHKNQGGESWVTALSKRCCWDLVVGGAQVQFQPIGRLRHNLQKTTRSHLHLLRIYISMEWMGQPGQVTQKACLFCATQN